MRVRVTRAVAATLCALIAGACTGGGDEEPEAAPTTAATAPAPAPGAAAGGGVVGGPQPGDPPIETFEVFSSKNPFTPLVPTGGGTGTGSGGTGTGTGGTGTGTGGTGTGTGGTGTGTGTGGTGTGGTRTATGGSGAAGGAEPRSGDRVALLDVFVEDGQVLANIRVNDTVHKVGKGDTFADRFKVLSVSHAEKCARLLFGDDPFRLCRGQQVVK